MNSNGIGQGLNIVKQIVENYHGFVTVDSEGLGQGSTFSVSIKLESEFDSK